MRQIYLQFRDLILSRCLVANTKLPPTRDVAVELGCSRSTVVVAFEQLTYEGYLETRRRGGTFVSSYISSNLLSRDAPRAQGDCVAGRRSTLASRGEKLASSSSVLPYFADSGFRPGDPDLAEFPFDIWTRLMRKAWLSPKSDLLRAMDPRGYLPLRQTIAHYLGAYRRIACKPAQIMITNGAVHAFSLIARLVLEDGDAVWMENPSHPAIRGPFLGATARIVPVTVDRDGMRVDDGCRRNSNARLAVVSPSHQYPLGVMMTLQRRLELLQWASSANAYVVEDDYDCEYRYSGKHAASLKSLDHEDRVFYVGSFSKFLFESVRVGFIVLPEGIADKFAQARMSLESYCPSAIQPVLHRFIEEGHFARHVKRMRDTYWARQHALLKAGAQHLAGLIRLAPDNAGIHLVGFLDASLKARFSDREIVHRASRINMTLRALSEFYMEGDAAQGLIFGYASVPVAEMEWQIKRLAAILH